MEKRYVALFIMYIMWIILGFILWFSASDGFHFIGPCSWFYVFLVAYWLSSRFMGIIWMVWSIVFASGIILCIIRFFSKKQILFHMVWAMELIVSDVCVLVWLLSKAEMDLCIYWGAFIRTCLFMTAISVTDRVCGKKDDFLGVL